MPTMQEENPDKNGIELACGNSSRNYAILAYIVGIFV